MMKKAINYKLPLLSKLVSLRAKRSNLIVGRLLRHGVYPERSRRVPRNYTLIVLIFGFCGLSFIMGCEKKEITAEQKEIIPVKTEQVSLGVIKEALNYVGDIKAQEEALIYPKVSGKILEKLKEEGSTVNKADVIAYIDRDEVGFKFEKAPVESPIRGIIGMVYVDIGTNVTPESAIALVVDMDAVEIDLNIPEKYLPRISIGQTAEISVDAYPGDIFKGEVSKISPVLDLATRTAPIELVIENKDHRLKSGMFAKVNLVLKEHQKVPVIIKEAVFGKEPFNYVYVIENNIAHQRNVKLGIREAANYEVLEGLKENEAVVIMGEQRLYEGAEVIVEE
ncbi:MAG: efflux RND transporter periplasmic adaptor subunit [Candidatus Omnitrophota bacterium]